MKSVKESYSSNRNFDSHHRKLAMGVTVGGAAIATLIALNVGNNETKPSELPSDSETPSLIEAQPQRDLPSTVVGVGQFTPIAAETKYYITITEDLPEPTDVAVTFNIPAHVFNLYHKGQELSPQQTNELIDSAIE